MCFSSHPFQQHVHPHHHNYQEEERELVAIPNDDDEEEEEEEEEEEKRKEKSRGNSWRRMNRPGRIREIMQNLKGFFLLTSFAPNNHPPADEPEEEKTEKKKKNDTSGPKPGGWKTMPYIIGNETVERVASFGVTINLTVYLMRRYNMPQVTAVNVNNIWSGTSGFAPLIGAFVADAYLGKFKTIAYGCVATFLGMLVMTLAAGIHGLQPPRCADTASQLGQCVAASGPQMAVLVFAFVLLAVGGGGVRPCNIPFGMDQFDRTTEAGRQGTNSFFNWYYTTNTAAVMVALTLVVYVQDSVSWVIGFAVPTLLMLLAIALFYSGAKKYIYFQPEGSIFSGIAQVFVAAFKKRRLRLPSPAHQESELYIPPLQTTNSIVIKLPLTQQYSFLNKAAICLDGELDDSSGSPAKPWRLSPVQRIEETKCLIRVFPIWFSGIMCFVAIGQQWTIGVLQALTMDRHLGPHFQIPPGSLGAFSLLAIVFFLPIYDRIFVPVARKLTGHEAGITLLQRMGAGIAISAFSMVVAGLVEFKRRSLTSNHSGTGQMSVLWLVPQLALVGISEAFNGVGQIEFFNQQFPEQMRSIATALFCCSQAVAGYLSTIVITIVQKKTGKDGRPSWLDNNINAGRVDYFYYLLAFMGAVNFIYFLICAYFYHYKGVPDVKPRDEEGKHILKNGTTTMGSELLVV